MFLNLPCNCVQMPAALIAGQRLPCFKGRARYTHRMVYVVRRALAELCEKSSVCRIIRWKIAPRRSPAPINPMSENSPVVT